jgi:hypothetical protein
LADVLASFIDNARRNDKYASEVVRSTYIYPPEYKGPKPIDEQIITLVDAFGLSGAKALEYSRRLPDLKDFVPEKAQSYVGWFAFPKNATREQVLAKIAEARTFYNYRASQMNRFRRHMRTEMFINTLADQQNNSDILLVAAQLGLFHRGESTRRADELFVPNEFGLDTVIGGSVTLTHSTRFVRWEQLHMDLPGDQFDDPDSAVRFDRAAYLYWGGGGLEFGTGHVGNTNGLFGSASGFLPQK